MINEGLKITGRRNRKFFCFLILSGSILLSGCYTQLAFTFDESETNEDTANGAISTLPVVYPGYPDPEPPPVPIQPLPSPGTPAPSPGGGAVQNPPSPTNTSDTSTRTRSQTTQTSIPADTGARTSGDKRTGR